VFLAARMAATNAAARGEPNPVVMSQPGRVGQPGTGPGETLPSAFVLPLTGSVPGVGSPDAALRDPSSSGRSAHYRRRGREALRCGPKSP